MNSPLPTIEQLHGVFEPLIKQDHWGFDPRTASAPETFAQLVQTTMHQTGRAIDSIPAHRVKRIESRAVTDVVTLVLTVSLFNLPDPAVVDYWNVEETRESPRMDLLTLTFGTTLTPTYVFKDLEGKRRQLFRIRYYSPTMRVDTLKTYLGTLELKGAA